MPRAAQADLPVAAEANADGFAVRFKRRESCRRLVLARIVRIELFQIQVLSVGPGIGQSPRHVAVAADNDRGDAGQGAADNVLSGKGEMRKIPDRGNAE